MNKPLLVVIGLLGCSALAARGPVNAPDGALARAGFVDVRQLVPDMAEDIKYAGSDNFVGVQVDGYEAPRCYLLAPAARALARVEASLRPKHQRLLIWDCYRPTQAVAHFMRWAKDLGDQRTKAVHYPALDKTVLLGDYIAPRSGHSRGATVDLTMMQCDANDQHCVPLDMGTGFDVFDTLAHTDSPRATAMQHAHREQLKSAMESAGFNNYAMEWWHYTFKPEPSPDTYYDLPVR
ncbi:M15 family metallopeptidase [Dyella terrae]|uniref:M15 family metallopeptidase n=1 Tax=Dyella TaxID=231454 RepID=UPI003CCDB883